MSDFNFNLQNLLQSLHEIEKASYAEKAVEIFGKRFILGVLSAADQVQIHEYCSKTTNRIAYILNYQVEVLAHAIKGIDNEYFGREKFFPTGEFDEDGRAVKKQKHVFWREIITKWNAKLREKLYKEYDQLEQEFNQSLEGAVSFIEEPQEEPPPPPPEPEQFRKIDEKRVEAQHRAQQPNYADSSFISLEEASDLNALYDEKGNLTAEGNAVMRALNKLKNNEQTPGVEVRYEDEELQQEEEEIPQEDSTSELQEEEPQYDQPQMNEAFEQLQEKVAQSGGSLVKANNNLTKLTQLHSESEVSSKKPANNIDQQQAAKIFQRIDNQRQVKKPTGRRPFELSPKELAKLSHVERMKYDIERQKYQDSQRDLLRNDDDVQLTSKSKPLLGGAPPGKERSVADKYKVK